MSSTTKEPGVEAERITVKSWDGLELVADCWGPADGLPVVLAHGGGQTRHAWGGTAKLLGEHGWRAMSFDMRGHGDSGWSDKGNYGNNAMGQDLCFIAAQQSAPTVLVGASMGGMASMVAVAESSDQSQFAAIILVDVTPRLEQKGIKRIRDFMHGKAEEGFASLEEAADYVAGYVQDRPRPKDVSGLAKNLRLGDDGRYRWHWDPAMFQFSDKGFEGQTEDRTDGMQEAARKLSIPALLVRGKSSDVVSKEGAQEFLDLVPHAEFVDVTGAGHMVAGDKNDAFSDAVVDFLRRLDS